MWKREVNKKIGRMSWIEGVLVLDLHIAAHISLGVALVRSCRRRSQEHRCIRGSLCILTFGYHSGSSNLIILSPHLTFSLGFCPPTPVSYLMSY